MPFCRHCGDLVLKDRCVKCGGTPVAASYSWNAGKATKDSQDKWKQTYTVEKQSQDENVPEATPSTSSTSSTGITTPNTTRRFPRPGSIQTRTPINNKISAHISATTSNRTPSPTKYGSSAASLADTLNSSPSGNPVLDDGTTLSKVYGSVLQNPETLKSYACANCDTVFNRDATLFPDPETPSRMLCRPCFLLSGGVKGECAGCQKPVTRLRNEGQFVENSGKVWHKRCFICDGCSKELASNPSVDLYGRPCCPDCFDTSLQRPVGSKTSTPRPSISLNGVTGTLSSSKENSPVIVELNRRLGVQTKSDTPLKGLSFGSEILESKDTTPTAPRDMWDSASARNLGRGRSSTMPGQLDDLTKRLQASVVQDASFDVDPSKDTKPLEGANAENQRIAHPLNTPDLTSDVSDGAESTWSGPSTPKPDNIVSIEDENATCGKCGELLFSIIGGGKIVTVPADSGRPGKYHSKCFVCALCSQPFAEKDGSAAFVVTDEGLTHLKCAPAPKPKIITRQRPVSMMPIMPSPALSEAPKTTNTTQRPQSALSVTSPTTGSFSFPSKHQCAGCQRMVALMEPGVVPGPKGTRWHSSCLVCGGKGATRQVGEPGCGKKLDRDAKLDAEGKTWCSTCMTLIALNGKSSVRSPVSATYGRNWLPLHGTGASLASQSTGSSISTVHGEMSGDTQPSTPTGNSLDMLIRRSGTMSPTKGLGGTVPVNRSLSTKRPPGMRPRPKSISVLSTLGGNGTLRASRGLNLVQEMTGSSTSTTDTADQGYGH